jgi:hypothetical protein
MANIVITDTGKTGWIKIEYNAYYSSNVNHKLENVRKECISAIDIISVGGVECVEVMGVQEFSQYFTHDAASQQFYIVDSVNGVAPTSVDDLKTKLLALL